MSRRLRCGIAVEIGRALLSIGALAIFWLLALEFYNPMKAKADEMVVNQTAQQAIEWNAIAMNNYLLISLAIVVLGTIATSVYLRQGGF